MLELGATPGGWTQVVLEAGITEITAVDIKEMQGMEEVNFIKCDIEDPCLVDKLSTSTFDVVLSDISPKSCGIREVDHINIINFAEIARDLSFSLLSTGGSFVTKILHGYLSTSFFSSLKPSFSSVEHFKPKSSRSESSEIYIVARGFNGHIPELPM